MHHPYNKSKFCCRPDIFILFLILALLVTYPLVLHFASGVIVPEPFSGTLPEGDHVVFLWSMWWAKTWFTHGMWPFYTDYLAAPQGFPLTYVTTSQFWGVVSIPLQFLFSLTTIYNLFFIVSLSLTGYGTFLLVRYLGGSTRGAVFSGVIAGFSSYHLAHSLHLNLVSTFWIPFVMLWFIEMIDTRHLKYAVYTGLGMAALTYCSFYLTIFLTCLVVIYICARLIRSGDTAVTFFLPKYKWALWGLLLLLLALPSFFLTVLFGWVIIPIAFIAIRLWSQQRHPDAQRLAGVVLAAATLFAIIIAPYLYSALTTSSEEIQEKRPLASKIFYSAEPLSYFMPDKLYYAILGKPENLHDPGEFFRIQSGGEFTNFLGFTLLVLCVVMTCVLRRRLGGKKWLVAAAVFFVLSLGVVLKFNGVVRTSFTKYDGVIVLPGALFLMLPFTDIIRVFTRFGWMTLLCLSLCVGINWKAFEERIGLKKAGASLGIILLCVGILSERGIFTQRLNRISVPLSYEALSELPRDALLFHIPSYRGWQNIFLQTQHGHKIVNSFSYDLTAALRRFYRENEFLAMCMPEHAERFKGADPDALRFRLLENIRNLGISHIVLHTDNLTNEQLSYYTSLLETYLNFSIIVMNKQFILYKIPYTISIEL